ncbi:MAG: hypothetical protein NDJ18_04225 [candidate division Zixibacteria bacterium]|nr:hypothetical protein [candidate division Zixibacteria bacterium]
MKPSLRSVLILAPAIAIYAVLCLQLNFTQDDAYISYRYVANFLNGHGLVFNIGEQVEGYTNFFWVIFMALAGSLGADYIQFSKLLGALCGAGTIVVWYLIAEHLFFRRSVWYVAMTIALVACNGAFAYWSPAGLETAAFALAVSLAIYWYLMGNWLLVAALSWAVLLRPEGAVLAALLIVAEFVSERKFPRFSVLTGLIAFVFCLPFVGFKLAYFGSILPNPFYAKTGFDSTQLANGTEYVWFYLKHYGFLGIGIALALLFYQKLSTELRALLVILLGYLLYILLVGGDVLKVHRFFLPVFGLHSIVAAAALYAVVGKLELKTQHLLVIVVMIPLMALTWWIPRQYVLGYNQTERAFVHRMGALASAIVKVEPQTLTVATPTIGKFGFELLGHRVIDMLGLADTTIARRSEAPIPGMVTTWKESKHNSAYLLGQNPDYIVFSTGHKPSAPAERALILYPEFNRAYRGIVWFYQHAEYSPQGMLNTAFKRVREIQPIDGPRLPVEYSDLVSKGLDAQTDGRHAEGIELLTKARSLAVRQAADYFTEAHWSLALAYLAVGRSEQGVQTLSEALAIDSFSFGPHRDLYSIAVRSGDFVSAEIHRSWLRKLTPWYLPRLDSLTNQQVERLRRSRN